MSFTFDTSHFEISPVNALASKNTVQSFKGKDRGTNIAKRKKKKISAIIVQKKIQNKKEEILKLIVTYLHAWWLRMKLPN